MRDELMTEQIEQPWFGVGVYFTQQRYGGPEEGGWWYYMGSLYTEIIPRIVPESDITEAVIKLQTEIKVRGLNDGLYPCESVISTGYYTVEVFESSLPKHYPERIPKYN